LRASAPDFSPEASITLVGTDTESAMLLMTEIHDLWSSLVEIAVGTYLLYRQLGAACAIPIAVSFSTFQYNNFS
jgi:ATP-binding cassette, subfamily C (CFTR/MRP), member 1